MNIPFCPLKPPPELAIVVEYSAAQSPKSDELSLDPSTLAPRPRLVAGDEELEMTTQSQQNGSINQNGSIMTARDENTYGENSGQSTQLR